MERGKLIAGRYELGKRLGRGGMGEVWAARDRTLHRDVALKLLAVDGAVHAELPQRFEREAVAAAQINHPHVVALYDRGVHEDMLFLVMEKVKGATLTEYIHAKSPVPPARALEIVSGICAALVAAHEARVIHYDIKPHNVMVTPDGDVKVVDFGIAGFVQATFSVARSSQLTPAGTPEYGAPEQFLTERGDERSDLYALGGVLFTLLAGQPPFTGHNGLAVMRRKLDEEAPHLDSLRPDLPPAVTALVAELLQRDPERRPQSARHVHERLQQLQAGLGPSNTGAPTLPTKVEQPPPPSTTADDTQQPPKAAAPFAISWTGKEPLSTYTDSSGKGCLAGFARVLLAVTLPGIVIPLLLHRIKVGEQNDSGWMAWFVLSIVLGPIALGILLWLRTVAYRFRTSGWSLYVGPQGIATTSTTGRREYRWNQVNGVTIEEIDAPIEFNLLDGSGSRSARPYRYTGLHAQFTIDAARSAPAHPAGWPPSHPGKIAVRKSGLIPVCVLGPLTTRQRTELTEVLAQYAEVREGLADPSRPPT
ncbi:serine/threonine-protein kinase [Streptomyces sp. NPDC052043]|uniref:serine/threonine-protein kinase n=1 Tax=Streptomyces sp. NPDC052043 TaxID=3365684 RepID=UPI0037CEEF93